MFYDESRDFKARLKRANITKTRFAELTGNTLVTVSRWGEQPPQWVWLVLDGIELRQHRHEHYEGLRNRLVMLNAHITLQFDQRIPDEEWFDRGKRLESIASQLRPSLATGERPPGGALGELESFELELFSEEDYAMYRVHAVEGTHIAGYRLFSKIADIGDLSDIADRPEYLRINRGIAWKPVEGGWRMEWGRSPGAVHDRIYSHLEVARTCSNTNLQW